MINIARIVGLVLSGAERTKVLKAGKSNCFSIRFSLAPMVRQGFLSN